MKLGHIALEGTKVKANASRHKAMSYGRMQQEEKRLTEEIQALLAKAEAIDRREDEQYGSGCRGDELPEELARRESRLKRIREAKKVLEAEAKAAAQEAQEQREQGDLNNDAVPKVPLGRPPKDLTVQEKMACKLRTKKRRETYSKRKSIVEPVFGQIKAARGFVQFSLRCLEKMPGEWTIVCLTHNLLKLFRVQNAVAA